MCRVIGLLFLFAALIACGAKPPLCPYVDTSEPVPSAGCFAATSEGLLLVQGINGQISVPGGSSFSAESPRCAAFRETWEETGLQLRPAELLAVFDTGFHLYRCEQHADSGSIDPPPRLEVRAAFYLPVERFEDYEWRFGYQRELLKKLMIESASVPAGAHEVVPQAPLF